MGLAPPSSARAWAPTAAEDEGEEFDASVLPPSVISDVRDFLAPEIASTAAELAVSAADDELESRCAAVAELQAELQAALVAEDAALARAPAERGEAAGGDNGAAAAADLTSARSVLKESFTTSLLAAEATTASHWKSEREQYRARRTCTLELRTVEVDLQTSLRQVRVVSTAREMAEALRALTSKADGLEALMSGLGPDTISMLENIQALHAKVASLEVQSAQLRRALALLSPGYNGDGALAWSPVLTATTSKIIAHTRGAPQPATPPVPSQSPTAHPSTADSADDDVLHMTGVVRRGLAMVDSPPSRMQPRGATPRMRDADAARQRKWAARRAVLEAERTLQTEARLKSFAAVRYDGTGLAAMHSLLCDSAAEGAIAPASPKAAHAEPHAAGRARSTPTLSYVADPAGHSPTKAGGRAAAQYHSAGAGQLALLAALPNSPRQKHGASRTTASPPLSQRQHRREAGLRPSTSLPAL
jgi:hypothetical protein